MIASSLRSRRCFWIQSRSLCFNHGIGLTVFNQAWYSSSDWFGNGINLLCTLSTHQCNCNRLANIYDIVQPSNSTCRRLSYIANTISWYHLNKKYAIQGILHLHRSSITMYLLSFSHQYAMRGRMSVPSMTLLCIHHIKRLVYKSFYPLFTTVVANYMGNLVLFNKPGIFQSWFVTTFAFNHQAANPTLWVRSHP